MVTPTRRDVSWTVCLALALGCACGAKTAGTTTVTPPTSLPVDVLTHHNDVARSGANTSETVLTTTNVAVSTFGKLWSLPVDGLVFAQPLYVSGLKSGGKTRNLLIVATGHNSVYAFDADAAGDPVWHASLGPTIPASSIPDRNIAVEIGVLSTPVISVDSARDSGLVYVTCKTVVDGAQTFALHVLDLATGRDVTGSPKTITAVAPGTADGSMTVAFTPAMHEQRPALLLIGDTVYIAFGSNADQPPYHGWVMAYRYDPDDPDDATISQTAVLNVTPDGADGAIWQSGAGPAADTAGNIYVMTSNGTVSAGTGGSDYSQAFLKLDAQLHIEDWFIPRSYASLNELDQDVGAGGPVLLPGTDLVAGGGKGGTLYVVDTDSMGHLDLTADRVLQSFSAGLRMYGAPVVWSGAGAPRLYDWPTNSGLKAYEVSKGQLDPTPVATSTMTSPAVGNAVGVLSISSNGDKAGTGIVWATLPDSNPTVQIVTGALYAFDAVTLGPLWNSRQNAARDDIGEYAKLVPPTVVNGHVYVATGAQDVLVYGLLPTTP